MKIAVLVPCFNEEVTVAQVVRDFKATLPEAEITVFDNNSTDRTAELARQAGAIVHLERRQGKGFVVMRMFETIDADVYVMVDGDNTYPADAVRRLIQPVIEGRADMVVGSRLHAGSKSEFRLLNRLGNYFFAGLFRLIFRAGLTDILSGYRAFNRRFVEDIPLFGGGFEIEAELTVKALQRGYRIVEIPVDLVPRPAHSHSKIRIVHDGFVILSTILALVRDYKPLTVFGSIGTAIFVTGIIPSAKAILDYASTGTLNHPAQALIGVWLLTVGALFVLAGVILHSVSRHFQELTYHLARLQTSRAKERQEAHSVTAKTASHGQ